MLSIVDRKGHKRLLFYVRYLIYGTEKNDKNIYKRTGQFKCLIKTYFLLLQYNSTGNV